MEFPLFTIVCGQHEIEFVQFMATSTEVRRLRAESPHSSAAMENFGG